MEPKHFHITDHVPMKNRAPMFGLTTIDDNTWLIGDRAVLSRRHNKRWTDDTPGLIHTWVATGRIYYATLEAPSPPPSSRPWKPEDDPTLVYLGEGGGASLEPGTDDDEDNVAELARKCVYNIGGIMIKMHHTMHCESTDENKTIDEIWNRLQYRLFQVPLVMYHARYDNCYFLAAKTPPGEPAAKIWWDLDDQAKDHYASLIATSCVEIATLTSSKLAAGIDGTVVEGKGFGGLLVREDKPDLLANCKALGLDVESPFCLYHGDLGPASVLIDTRRKEIGIINWQAAQYVPREWIGMSFGCGLGMMLDEPIPDGYEAYDYAERVWKALYWYHGFRNDGRSVWLEWQQAESNERANLKSSSTCTPM